MKNWLSYVIITPNAIQKGQMGGIITRIIHQLQNTRLIGIAMVHPKATFANEYSKLITKNKIPSNPEYINYNEFQNALIEYIKTTFIPENKFMIMLFDGPNAKEEIQKIIGTLIVENKHQSIDTTIHKTFSHYYLHDNQHKSENKYYYIQPSVISTQNINNTEYYYDELKILLNGLALSKHTQNDKKNKNTLAIIKPDIWNNKRTTKIGTIIEILTSCGFMIEQCKIHATTRDEAIKFYEPIKNSIENKKMNNTKNKLTNLFKEKFDLTLNDKEMSSVASIINKKVTEMIFDDIIYKITLTNDNNCNKKQINKFETEYQKYTKSSCMALILKRDDAIKKLRDTIGATNPKDAMVGTIRKEFGLDISQNTIHASDSWENVQRESEIIKINDNNLQKIIKIFLSELKKYKS